MLAWCEWGGWSRRRLGVRWEVSSGGRSVHYGTSWAGGETVHFVHLSLSLSPPTHARAHSRSPHAELYRSRIV